MKEKGEGVGSREGVGGKTTLLSSKPRNHQVPSWKCPTEAAYPE